MRVSIALTCLLFVSVECQWEQLFDARNIGKGCTHQKSREQGSLTYEKDCAETVFLDQNGRSSEINSYGSIPYIGRVVCCLPRVNLATVDQGSIPIPSRWMSSQKCGAYCMASDDHLDGVPAKPGEFPHMAAVGYINEETNEPVFDCGGTLISDKFVLTAAHCTHRKNRVPYIVRLGRTSLDLNDMRDSGKVFDSFVKKVHLAKEYSSVSKQHDIALLELDTPVDFDVEVCKNIVPACLPNPKRVESENRRFTVIGFGKNSTHKAKSTWLMKGDVQEYSRAECKKQFNGTATIYDGQICAYDPEGRVDTCEGDSGSSLQTLAKGLYYIYGITSFGVPCGSSFPSVYTKVAFYLLWIERIVWP